MSKESNNKKRLQKTDAPVVTNTKKISLNDLTAEQKAQIIRNRLANRPVLTIRYPNGKWNWRFLITLAALIVALIFSLYFISRTG